VSVCSSLSQYPTQPTVTLEERPVKPKKNIISNEYAYNNNSTTVLWSFIRDYPGEPVPEETLTHPPS